MKTASRVALWVILLFSLVLPAAHYRWEMSLRYQGRMAEVDHEIVNVGIKVLCGLILGGAVAGMLARMMFRKGFPIRKRDFYLSAVAFGALYLAFLYFARPEVLVPWAPWLLPVLGLFFVPLMSGVFLYFTIGGGEI